MISSLLSIKIHGHVIDNSNIETRGGGVKRDAGGDEKQLSLPGHIMFTRACYSYVLHCTN